ncbi:MAG: tyrosine-type recombinase/integrase [Turicibacter sp.]|nr:tyrosine-type recombinase/integrase [Turicibacter sp.]
MKGGVRERSKGKWSYYFKYKDEFDNWKTKEKGGFTSKKEAQTALRKAITEFEEDGFLNKKTVYTLEQYIEYWFENVASLNLRHNTLKVYRSIMKNHIYPDLGHLKFEKITPVIIQNFITKKAKECGNTTIAHVRKVLNGTFELAVKQRLIKQNPLDFIERIKKQQEEKEMRFLSRDEIDTVLREVSKDKYYLSILLAIHTGMRRGEVLGLTWDDIDLEEQVITINKQLLFRNKTLILSPTKTKSSNRKFIIPSILAIELKKAKEDQESNRKYYDEHYYSEHNFVCCKEDGSPLNPDSLSHYIAKLSKSIDIPFKFHDLRHSHASLLLEAGVNVKVIQERLGHSNIGTTLDVYSHVSQRLERNSIDKFEQLFATKK